MDVRRTGPWPITRKLLAALPARLAPVMRAAVAQEAHQLRAQIVDGLTRQAPAGAPFRPLTPLTLVSTLRSSVSESSAERTRGRSR